MVEFAYIDQKICFYPGPLDVNEILLSKSGFMWNDFS